MQSSRGFHPPATSVSQQIPRRDSISLCRSPNFPKTRNVQVAISLFERADDPLVLEVQEDEWPGLVDAFRVPRPPTTPKRALPLWSPATFRNGHRKKENVEQVSLIVLDVDEDPVPDSVALRSALAGVQAVVHSSSSASTTAPRWRAAVALSRPVSADEYQRLWSTFTSSLPFPVGQAAKDPSRAWYMARAASDGYYEVFETLGKPLDVEEWLSKSRELPAGISGFQSAPAPVSDPSKERKARLAAASTLLGRAWPEKNRHQAQLALAGALYHQRWAKEEALEFLCDVCRTAGNEERSKRAATIDNTWSRGERGETIQGWTSLESHISNPVVKAARELVKRNDIEELRQALKPSSPQIPEKDSPRFDGEGVLDFIFGAWESEPPPTEFLVEGLVPKECVAMWYGRADSLKTWLLFSMAVALSTGATWLGKYPTKKVKVGIVDYETGKKNVQKRLYMLRAGKNPNLGVACMTTLKPNQEEFWDALAAYKFDIVFVDSLRRANQGGEENDSGQAIRPLELASEFSEKTGCAVVYIHHARKEANDGWPEFRGSSAIEDQVDCAYVVRKSDASDTKKTVEIKCIKPGDMMMPEPFVAEVEFDDGKKTASLRVTDKKSAFDGKKLTDEEVDAAIRLALKDGPLLTLNDIQKKTKVKRDRSNERVNRLCKKGEVRRIPEVGYILDSSEARRERVFEAVERSQNWRSTSDLADGAHVPHAFVKDMVREGDIVRSSSGDDVRGFIRVKK